LSFCSITEPLHLGHRSNLEIFILPPLQKEYRSSVAGYIPVPEG
jgi:hypothetical protein